MLCYGVHPYEDSAKLRIINANYQIPEDDRQYTVFHDLISMFTIFYTRMYEELTVMSHNVMIVNILLQVYCLVDYVFDCMRVIAIDVHMTFLD